MLEQSRLLYSSGELLLGPSLVMDDRQTLFKQRRVAVSTNDLMLEMCWVGRKNSPCCAQGEQVSHGTWLSVGGYIMLE